MHKSKTTIAIPPGSTIREQLLDRGMMQKEFAVRMDLSEKHISRLITGQVELTYEVALRLESVLGIPAQFWNNLEAIYREKIVRIEEENEMIKELTLAKLFPYNEMALLGWVENSKNGVVRVKNLRSFFEVARLTSISELGIPGIAYRKVGDGKKSDYALAVWSQKARIEARNYDTSLININKLHALLPQIRAMTLKESRMFSFELKELLSACGIALVFLPHIKGSFLHGATFVDGNHIVIGLTLRGKTSDKFWFSLFHELHHIIKGDVFKPVMERGDSELEADRFARDVLIPMDAFERFISKGVFDQDTILDFAKKQEIAPGIVVGRLQKENIIPYNEMNGLKMVYAVDE